MNRSLVRNASIIIFGLLTFVALVAAVLLLEIFLESEKVPVFPFHNTLYPYVEFRPPANMTWQSDEPSLSSRNGEFAVAHTNRDSLRIKSPAYSLDRKKPVGQIRIAMIGGSTVHIGTRFEVTLPGALKRILRERYPKSDIEVINGGIISAISRQELIFLITTLVDYELDMIIVYDGINDSGQMLYYEKRPNFPYNYRIMEEAWNQYVAGRREPIWRQILRRSKILKSLWPEKFGSSEILERVTSQELIDDPSLRRVYADAHKDNWDKIRQVCSAYGIRPVFVLQPTSLYSLFPNGIRQDGVARPLQDNLYANYLVYEEFRSTIREFSEAHSGIGVLDLSSLLPEDEFFDGAHVYDEVNDRIATKLADFIMEDLDEMNSP